MTHFYIMMGKKLLVADDSLTIQKVIRLALSNEGYEIQAISDGNDAIQQISLFRPDVVLIDVSLPNQSAFEIKRAVDQQEDLQNIKFVLMSSAFEKVDESLAAAANFSGRLTKPFDPAHLRHMLAEVLKLPATEAADSDVPPESANHLPPLPMPPSLDKISLDFPANNDDFLKPLDPEEAVPAITDGPGTGTQESTIWDESVVGSSRGTPSSKLPHLPPMPPPLPFGQQTLHKNPLPEIPVPPPLKTKTPESKQIEIPVFEDPTPPQPESAPLAASIFGEPLPPRSMEDTDIKHLTESTIRMSGLDDFQWSINENAQKPENAASNSPVPPAPQPRPTANPVQTLPSDKDFPQISEDYLHENSPMDVEPTLPPPAGMADVGGTSFGGSGFISNRGKTPESGTYSSIPQPPSSSLTDPDVVPLTTGQMQEVLERQLRETLQQMAEKILPDLAEKVIKQEIRRMLHEQP